MEVEVRIAKQEDPLKAGIKEIGEPSSFARPECHGVLQQMKEGNLLMHAMAEHEPFESFEWRIIGASNGNRHQPSPAGRRAARPA